MTQADETKIRALIKAAIDKEFKSQKAELIIVLKKEIENANKSFLTKDDVKELMAKAFIKQNKFMWEKSKLITTFFKDI